MLFESQELKTSFTIPDEPTYREQLRYESAAHFHPELPTYERLWLGVCALAKDWKSEIVSDASEKVLDEKSVPQGIEVMKWAGLAVWSFVWSLKDVPKN